MRLHYTGTVDALNAEALQSADTAHLFLKNVPTTKTSSQHYSHALERSGTL